MRTLVILAAVVLAALVPAAAIGPAYGANFTVDSTVDAVDASPGNGSCATAGGQCTLRAAIQEADALLGDDTIDVPAGTYTLSIAGADENASATGDLDITAALTINGAGAATTIIDGADLDRVFDVGSGATAVILGLTIRNGTPTCCLSGGGGIINFGTTALTNSTVSGNSSAHAAGGGIFNSSGTLTLTNSTVSGNLAPGTGYGGGIFSFGTTTLTNSTVSGNTAGSGGGGIYHGSGTLTLTNSTVSGNSTTGSGGGIVNYGTTTLTNSTVNGNSTTGSGGGGINNAGTITLTNSTVNGNTATSSGGGIYSSGGLTTATVTITNGTISGNEAGSGGGGIYSYVNVTLTLTNSTVSGNTTTSLGGAGILALGAEDIRNTIVAGNGPAGGDCSGAVTSSGYNLDGDGTCGLTGPGDLSNTNPMLGSLANNGGPTKTHALLPGSPAIDAGDNAGCPTTDQRGAIRPQSTVCDIGAYEYGDSDADGISDPADNCPTVANALGQLDDADGDLAGDACDGAGSGNVDCSPPPNGVTSIDALKVLRHSASLTVSQSEPCLDIGAGPLLSGWMQGDVNCSGGPTPVNAVDALLILRASAGLSTNIPQGCPEIKPSFFYYTIQPGDTLAGIAEQFGTTVDAIATLNGINPDDPLVPGTVLAIPGSPL